MRHISSGRQGPGSSFRSAGFDARSNTNRNVTPLPATLGVAVLDPTRANRRFAETMQAVRNGRGGVDLLRARLFPLPARMR